MRNMLKVVIGQDGTLTLSGGGDNNIFIESIYYL